ncbi:nitrate reductase [Saccharobesus litoralis]|uniref:Nitrate reductase n=1 Tax=Saccharobesus litoralis TaxID=2172099 RepID=A0A2S0VVW0_9ALTE|nr:nitrate reductase [Saccharobesus litoralis]AWB68312.1 nitrate reductase [Saccharobesus litoralis]
MTVIFSTSDIDTIKTQNTTCPYCGVGCGVKATIKNNKLVAVEGRQDHPANQGRLCVKGSSLHETANLQNRLLSPKINGQTRTWHEALQHVADGFKQIIAEHGPNSVAFYLSGQLLTEDYYVANKLAKGFLGTANIDTNSRLCMASAVVAHKRAFGADAVPGTYEDIDSTDAVFFVGSNAAYAHPIVFQRINKAKQERDIKIVVIDPRRTATCDIADLHLPLKPGTDAYFYNGLLTFLVDQDYLDKTFIAQHTQGFAQSIAAARQQAPDIATVANICDLPEADVRAAYEIFANNSKVVSLFSQGINQSSSGVDKGNAIINCHLATGKIGREGAAPFSITGQPNAMGGREVGGLANQLAAHMSFNDSDIDRLATFWQASNMARQEGLKAVDLFDAIDRGQVKAVWIMGTNPVVSMPNADKVKRALQKCQLVVVSDCNDNTDTGNLADVLLPASTWGEKSGTVTNSDRTISRQQPFFAAPGEAKNDWQIICDFAKYMGFEQAFDFNHPYQIFAEHAALSGYQRQQSYNRAFDISYFANISQAEYENLKPVQWPVNQANPQGSRRLFSDGQFYTANGKAQFVPITARLPSEQARPNEFVMNTGRIRDQWHTMARTGKVARLLTHIAEPFVQINPQDAARLNIAENDLVECQNQGSTYLGRARLTEDQRVGDVFIPMHWNDAFAAHSRVGALVLDNVDPLCGQPEFKHSPARVRKFEVNYHGFIVTRDANFQPDSQYWAKVSVDKGACYPFADQAAAQDWPVWLQQTFPEINDWVDMHDPSNAGYRALGFIDGQLQVAFVVAASTFTLPTFAWLSGLLGETPEPLERFTWLAGQPGDDSASPGAIVCSCFQIGENQIKAAVAEGADTPEKLGKVLKCGTNCGSCIPELSGLIAKLL